MKKILIVTNMYPYEEMNYFGNFLKLEFEYMQSKGIEVSLIFINGRKNKLNYITDLFKFLKIYNKYDVIHYHHTYIAWYSFFVKNKKQFLTIHEGGNLTIKDNQLYPAYGHGRNQHLENIFKMLQLRKHIFNKMDKLILTRYTENKLYYKENIVKTNPMGIDFERFIIINKSKAREILGFDKDKIILFFPHEPRKEKNVELFNEIATEIEKKIGKKVIRVYGGKISSDEMYLYINAADICFLTSKFEASPTIVKEAMACGVPILCSRVGDLVELLSNEYSYYICGKKSEFVEMSEYLLSKNINRKKIREFILKKGMRYQETANNVIDFYNEV